MLSHPIRHIYRKDNYDSKASGVGAARIGPGGGISWMGKRPEAANNGP